jgi:hypothetical protein
MAKLQHLSVLEEAIFKFIRVSFQISVKGIKPELEKLLVTLKSLEQNHFETKTFIYLDVISWIESKLEQKQV